MPDEKANLSTERQMEFNMASRALRDRMSEAGKEKFDALNASHASDRDALTRDHASSRGDRVGEYRKELEQHNQYLKQAYRPRGAPPPALLTAEQIDAKAQKLVDSADARKLAELDWNRIAKLEDLSRKELGVGIGKPDEMNQLRPETDQDRHTRKQQFMRNRELDHEK